MNPENKWLKIVGIVLNVLVAGLLIFAGSGKAFGTVPEEIAKGMANYGLEDKIKLIGFGELTTAVLLLLPWTAPLGTLMASGFWGGVICIHMSHHEDIIAGIICLLVTWIGSYLRGSIPLFAGRR